MACGCCSVERARKAMEAKQARKAQLAQYRNATIEKEEPRIVEAPQVNIAEDAIEGEKKEEE